MHPKVLRGNPFLIGKLGNVLLSSSKVIFSSIAFEGNLLKRCLGANIAYPHNYVGGLLWSISPLKGIDNSYFNKSTQLKSIDTCCFMLYSI